MIFHCTQCANFHQALVALCGKHIPLISEHEGGLFYELQCKNLQVRRKGLQFQLFFSSVYFSLLVALVGFSVCVNPIWSNLTCMSLLIFEGINYKLQILHFFVDEIFITFFVRYEVRICIIFTFLFFILLRENIHRNAE